MSALTGAALTWLQTFITGDPRERVRDLEDDFRSAVASEVAARGIADASSRRPRTCRGRILPMRFDVIAASDQPKGDPVTVSSHNTAVEAAEVAKKEAAARQVIVEVHDKELGRAVFRARAHEWRWITR